MKKKQMTKKLDLNKKTIANMVNEELKSVRGGAAASTDVYCQVTASYC